MSRPVAVVAPSDDRELVQRAVAGDRAAFEAIYRAHADRVFALLTRLLGPDREREDLMQEVFIRLHPALARFRGECALPTFIYQITTRVAVDHLRRRRRHRADTLAAGNTIDLDAEIDPGLSPAEQAARRQELVDALTLLDALSPKLRAAFVLREVMGLSHDEVARIVDAHPAAARMRVALARRAIAKLCAKSPARKDLR
ncbi:MAG TPA: RNA polymerase sigma factor [Kofleriaceae bacterium]|nr:RNA polymerase sigma factor [Kofleriaceae bacterium]